MLPNQRISTTALFMASVQLSQSKILVSSSFINIMTQ